MTSSRFSPLVISASSVASLPRWALLVLLATFALAGFSGHNFWNARDEQVFALMWSMFRGGADAWVVPEITGIPYLLSGPAIAWPGAALMKMLVPAMSPLVLAKIPALVLFFIAAASVWYAAWHFARQADAAPIGPIFSEEANPRDYSRALADSAVLLFVSTFGIVARLHEIGLPIILIALSSVSLLGLALSLSKPRAGAVLAGIAAGCCALAASLYWALVLLAGTIFSFLLVPALKENSCLRILLAVAAAAAVAALWPLAATLLGTDPARWIPAWQAIEFQGFGFEPANALWVGRNFLWYLCPILPFAAYAVYAWRKVTGSSLILVPGICLLCLLAGLPFNGFSPEYTLLVMVPAMSAMGAFGLAALRNKSYKNLLDWFSAAIFSLAALALWGYFLAWKFGFPPKMAASLRRLAPAVVPWVETTLLVCTAAVTLLWLGFVIQRLRRQPKALWKGPWLSAMGLTLVWVIGTSLFGQMLDSYRSYAPVAREISGKAKIFGYRYGACVQGEDLPLALRGLLDYSSVRFCKPGQSPAFLISRYEEDSPLPADAIGLPTSSLRTEEVFVLRPGNSKTKP